MELKHLLFGILISISLTASAQLYNFSVSTGTYTDLVGSTSLNNGMTWDDPDFLFPLGFDFNLFDTTISQMYIEGGGLGGSLSTDAGLSGVRPLLIADGSDFIDRAYDFSVDMPTTGSLSNISYLLEGEAGSQILKLEWNNVGFYDDLSETGSSTDFLNLQMWFYEGSNIIEIRYGENSITQPELAYFGETGTIIGLMDQYDFMNDAIVGSGQVLEGEPSAATTRQISNIEDITSLDGTIPAGTIYTFSPIVSNLLESVEVVDNISLFPNPTKGQFNLSFDGEIKEATRVSILNTNGQVVRHIDQAVTTVDVSNLSAGTYVVQVESVAGVSHKKLIVE